MAPPDLDIPAMAGATGGGESAGEIVEKPHFACMTFGNSIYKNWEKRGGEEGQFKARDTCNCV